MDVYESHTHSFIVKVWLEETAEEAEQASWHGSITHIPSNERRYLKNLDEITEFIKPYLKKLGVQFKKPSLWKRWLNRSP